LPALQTHMIMASCCTCTIVNRNQNPGGGLRDTHKCEKGKIKESWCFCGIVVKMTCELGDELNESKNAESRLYASERSMVVVVVVYNKIM
jgi:hypothetical protein